MCYFVRKCWVGYGLFKIKIMMSIVWIEIVLLIIKEFCDMVFVIFLVWMVFIVMESVYNLMEWYGIVGEVIIF